MDLHAERGAVYGDVWRQISWSGLSASYGLALRIRQPSHPVAAVGFDWSREQTRLRFTLGGLE